MRWRLALPHGAVARQQLHGSLALLPVASSALGRTAEPHKASRGGPPAELHITSDHGSATLWGSKSHRCWSGWCSWGCWHDARVIVSLLYRATRTLLSIPGVLLRRDTAKDAELLVLRHENAVLRRQITGPVRYEPADRFWLTSLSSLVPRRRSLCDSVA
jgi:hypothetical protein